MASKKLFKDYDPKQHSKKHDLNAEPNRTKLKSAK